MSTAPACFQPSTHASTLFMNLTAVPVHPRLSRPAKPPQGYLACPAFRPAGERAHWHTMGREVCLGHELKNWATCERRAESGSLPQQGCAAKISSKPQESKPLCDGCMFIKAYRPIERGRVRNLQVCISKIGPWDVRL